MGKPATTNPCDTTAAPAPSPSPAPAPGPSPAPMPGCVDKPGDWKSSYGSSCADYVSKSWCTPDGDYGSGWGSNDEWGTFDTWAVNGVAANVACCGCGGGSTVSGKQACQGHSYDKVHHQHLRRDVLTNRVIGRVPTEAHAPITYQSHGVLLTVIMVAGGFPMTSGALSILGQSAPPKEGSRQQ